MATDVDPTVGDDNCMEETKGKVLDVPNLLREILLELRDLNKRIKSHDENIAAILETQKSSATSEEENNVSKVNRRSH